jgi:hypothetical protein
MFQAFKQRDFRAGTAGTHGGRDGDAAYTDTHFFEFIFHCFEGRDFFQRIVGSSALVAHHSQLAISMKPPLSLDLNTSLRFHHCMGIARSQHVHPMFTGVPNLLAQQLMLFD